MPERPPARLEPAAFEELPGWAEGDQDEAVPVLWRSCSRLNGDGAAPVGPDFVRGVAGDLAAWRRVCAALTAEASETAVDARAFFETHFLPYRVIGPDGPDGRFTGYYEIELDGARMPDARYRYPVYARPPGIDPERPFHTRAEIETGPIAADWPVLFYAADPVDVFFLHIQGSGVVRLPGGAAMRVGFAAHNGHDFVAIGRLLLDRGLIDRSDASAQGVMRWLRANPDQAADLMRENPRYIFFREIVGAGPIGAQGVPLTAGRSLAVDPEYIPLGAPLWLDTTMPGEAGRPLRRLVVAQDRGGAILGAVRGDLFWGTGDAALEKAGRMNQPGRYFLLLPRPESRAESQ